MRKGKWHCVYLLTDLSSVFNPKTEPGILFLITSQQEDRRSHCTECIRETTLKGKEHGDVWIVPLNEMETCLKSLHHNKLDFQLLQHDLSHPVSTGFGSSSPWPLTLSCTNYEILSQYSSLGMKKIFELHFFKTQFFSRRFSHVCLMSVFTKIQVQTNVTSCHNEMGKLYVNCMSTMLLDFIFIVPLLTVCSFEAEWMNISEWTSQKPHIIDVSLF